MSGRERVEALAKVLREHVARDRYREDGESIGTECTCGGWSGNYFADGEAGPFDDHLAEMLADSPAMRDLLAEAKADALREYRDALAANESAEHWIGRTAFLHDLGDWIKSIYEDNPYRETTTGGRDE